MPEVAVLLEALSTLRLDVEGHDGNSELLSRVSDAAEALAAYVADDSAETALLSEFESLHEALRQKRDAELRAANASVDKAQKELSEAEETHARLTEEVSRLKAETEAAIGADGDVIAAIHEAQELKDELQQLRTVEEQLSLEVQGLQHKLQALDEVEKQHAATRDDIVKRDRLLYEFVTSSLNITVVNRNESQVQLALLSESEDRTTQTWDCMYANLDECGPETADRLWEAIEKTFDPNSVKSSGDTVFDMVRLAR
ncbi:ankycorbin-like isoform X1, putative [Babesia ovata]|uniref:Ankycorbin-like isoform X1, putative n=1 Tax=Babesia ovata TaxID=189622 RepID=A0A2H6KD13_9APIC|nr:ankycorbin-like isoform X1, putative [Babesia ovata]GBE60886.1 ankycorbin-like isoform X1, putative [Babesia ovata]